MAQTSKTLQSALRKAKHHHSAEWAIYATPAEIQALLLDGAKGSGFPSATQVEKMVSNGDCQPRWFYFEAGRTKPWDTMKPSQHHQPRQKP